MTTVPRCQQCGARLPSGTPDNLCPLCCDDAAPDSEVRILGNCEIAGELGRGGMGVVWRGRQRALQRDVAVKTLPGGSLAGPEALARFRTEALAAARLQHPGIVTVYEVGEEDGLPYLVMELVQGRTLAAVLGGKPAISTTAARWLHDAAMAVEHAHSHGVLHRDLKPSNILIEDAGGAPRVMDFGLARLTDEESSLTLSGAAMGSPAFMPPEQARGEPASPRSDVYGLGAVLYCALTGRPPFQGEHLAVVLSQVQHAEPVPPRRLNASVPADLETICLKCMDKIPVRRYLSAGALADDLARFLDGRPVTARPLPWPARLWRHARRHPGRGTAIILTALMAGGIFLTLLWRAETERRHAAELRVEKAAAQLGEARAMIRLRLADSRPRAEAMAGAVLSGDPPPETRAAAREVLLAAMALPSARLHPLAGEGVDTDDWTMCAGDFLRDRWALAGEDGRISIRTLNDGRDLSAFSAAAHPVTAVLTFSPGGRWLAVRHREDLGIWDTTPGAAQGPAFMARTWPAGTAFGFMKVALAPDDSAVLWNDGAEVVATALPGGRELARWRSEGLAGLRCGAMTFSPDGTLCALAHQDEPEVELRTWPDGSVQRRFSGRVLQPLCAVALSPGAAWIAGGDNAGRVTLWRGDGSRGGRREFTGHTAAIRGLTFSAGGRHLASASEDGTVRVWDCTAGTAVTSLAWDSALPSFARDGLTLGTGSAGGRLVYGEVTFSPLLQSFRPPADVEKPQQLSFWADSRSLVCLGDGGAYRCAVPGGDVLGLWPFEKPQTVLATQSGAVFVGGPSGIKRWETASPAGAAADFLPASRWGWDSLCASADGQWITATDNANRHAAVWLATDADASHVRYLTAEVGTGELALSPDGMRAAVAHRYDSGLLIFDVKTSSIMHRLDLPPRHSLAWSPDGRWLAASGTTTPLWETATWENKPLPALPPNHPPAGALAFAWPDKSGAVTLLATATGNSRIALVTLPAREVAAILTPPAELALYRLAFSRDGQWLAASTARGEVQLWKLSEIPGLR